ncbi:MAG: diguanylate cyclase, partial [Sulfurimonas sp.]|nr:diguanylate cyclase [Sulfurimonas sp.]
RIEKERFVYFYKDQMTSIYNKEYLGFILAYNDTNKFNVKCINVIYLHNFSQYNTKYGWDGGDKLLEKFAEELNNINTSDYVFRIYGDDFIILNKEHFEIEKYIPSLEKILADTGVTLTHKHFDINKENITCIEDLEDLL